MTIQYYSMYHCLLKKEFYYQLTSLLIKCERKLSNSIYLKITTRHKIFRDPETLKKPRIGSKISSSIRVKN